MIGKEKIGKKFRFQNNSKNQGSGIYEFVYISFGKLLGEIGFDTYLFYNTRI